MTPSHTVTLIGLMILAMLAVAHSKIPGLRRPASRFPTPRTFIESQTSVGGAVMIGCAAIIITVVCHGLLYNAGTFLVRLTTWGRVQCAPFQLEVPRSRLPSQRKPQTVSMNRCLLIGLFFWILLLVALIYIV